MFVHSTSLLILLLSTVNAATALSVPSQARHRQIRRRSTSPALDKRFTQTREHQLELMDPSTFSYGDGGLYGSDELKGAGSGAISADFPLTPHEFELMCIKRDAEPDPALKVPNAQSSCGLPFAAMLSRSGKDEKTDCTGFVAANMICGACLEIRANGKTTHARVVSNHGGGTGLDLSFTNYKEVAMPEDYALSYLPPSGAGSNPITAGSWKEVHGSMCDKHWDGRCLPNLYAGVTAASTAYPYHCE